MSHEYAPFLRCPSIAEMNRGLLNPGAAMRGDQRRDKRSPGTQYVLRQQASTF